MSRAPVPKKLSPGEEGFALACRLNALDPKREFRFCERRWRVDFAFPEKKLAIEIEGGVWSGGRHVRGTGYSADLEKHNALAILGWRLLRFSTAMVENGTAINTTLAMLAGDVPF